MASQINASNSGFGGIVSTGDSSGVLQLQTVGTTAVTLDTSQNATFAGKVTSAGALTLASNGSTTAVTIDTSQNVGINNSNPAQFDTSGEVLNISGAAANTNPSVLFMAGNGGGAGYEATEVFAIAGITAATEITRNTGTGANGFRAYLKVTVTGHSGGVGNGINIKEFYWDGGTGAPVQISTYTNGSVPVISFDNTTSNVWIVKLASSNGTASFNGVMKVEWLMPVDFASSTWTIS